MTTYNPEAKKRNAKFPSPILYLSGGFTVPIEKEKSWLKRTGCTHKCYSYGYVRPGALYHDERVQGTFELDVKEGIGIMMDSSAFSFHVLARKARAKGMTESDVAKLRDKVIKDYAKFIKEQKHHGQIDFYVNFDYVKHCPTIYKMQHRFQDQGLRPMPIYHGDSSFDWLRKYLDEGHDYLGVGSDKNLRPTWDMKRRYLNDIFEITSKYKNIRLHGFGLTGHPMMFGWPWYSCDSSTWAKIAAYGQILIVDPNSGRMKYVHVSTSMCVANKNQYGKMEKSVKRTIRDFVEEKGFDFDLIRREPYERALFCAYMFSHIHEFVSRRDIYSTWEKIL